MGYMGGGMAKKPMKMMGGGMAKKTMGYKKGGMAKKGYSKGGKVKVRGTGAATKGLFARGPMG